MLRMEDAPLYYGKMISLYDLSLNKRGNFRKNSLYLQQYSIV